MKYLSKAQCIPVFALLNIQLRWISRGRWVVQNRISRRRMISPGWTNRQGVLLSLSGHEIIKPRESNGASYELPLFQLADPLSSPVSTPLVRSRRPFLFLLRALSRGSSPSGFLTEKRRRSREGCYGRRRGVDRVWLSIRASIRSAVYNKEGCKRIPTGRLFHRAP